MKAYPSTNECQLCKGNLRQFSTFYDGKVFGSSWAWVCADCWSHVGGGLGTGLGQEYDSKTDEKLRG